PDSSGYVSCTVSICFTHFETLFPAGRCREQITDTGRKTPPHPYKPETGGQPLGYPKAFPTEATSRSILPAGGKRKRPGREGAPGPHPAKSGLAPSFHAWPLRPTPPMSPHPAGKRGRSERAPGETC